MMFPAMLLAVFAQPKLPGVTLEDLKQFPSVETVQQNEEFAWKHQCWARGNAGSDWATEAHDLWDVWNDLRIAQSAEYVDSYRLMRLSCIRHTIGVRAYYQGAMPPPAPYWRFKERQP